MTQQDSRGCAVSGATSTALGAYDTAVAKLLAWRSGVDADLATALHESPDFVMAHALQAHLLLGSRDPARVRAAQPVLQRAQQLRCNEREAAHLQAIAALLGDDFEGAKDRLAALLRRYPRDALALHVAHSLDYVTGDIARMRDRVEALLPAWSKDLPGYHALLAMHAFGLVENGEVERGEDAARAALALNGSDARAHHAMAHAFDSAGHAVAGLAWLHGHAAEWADRSAVVTHGWWHAALFHLELGQIDRALALYDHRIRAGRSRELADLIDAASLLWRIELRGGKVGSRWFEISQAWVPRIEDAYCSFSDVHAMLALVGARDWASAQHLERTLAASRAKPTRHGQTTQQLGLRACRGLLAFGRGNYALAITLLAGLPAHIHGLGGSHAQRDVLHLTLLQAVQRMRRPARRPRIAAPFAVYAS